MLVSWTTILILCIVLFILYIYDKRKMEFFNESDPFKSIITFTKKILNDPHKLAKYKAKLEEEELKRGEVDTFSSVNRIQSNTIISSSIKQHKKSIKKSARRNSKSNSIESFISVDFGQEYINRNKPKVKVDFNPIIKNTDNKYKLYGDNFFVPESAGKIENDDVPNIDQTVNLNIMDYVNNATSKNKTIKEIYDDLTNDNRLVLQEDLDNLQTSNINNNFIIGEKYGATRFDTYSVK